MPTNGYAKLDRNRAKALRESVRSYEEKIPIMNDRTDFKMIPDNEEIASLKRDLHFYPTQNDNPTVLTSAQIEAFNTKGHIEPLPILNEEETLEQRNYFDDLLARELAAGRDSYSISSAHLKLGPIHDLMNDPRIVAIAQDLLGEDVIGWGAHFFCKLPHDGKRVDWHQDASYWPLTPSKAITFWLAIDDADKENGCMEFISGSHHHGHMTYRPSDDHAQNVLNQTIEAPEQYGSMFVNPVKAGHASVHSDLLLHGSDPNASDRRRCALTLRYCAADVRAHLGWNEKGVWVAGKDDSGHWSNRERPT